MACEGSTDDQIGEALLIGVVEDQVKRVTNGDTSSLDLPQIAPITNAQDQRLFKQLGETIKVIGDELDKDPHFNNMIDVLVSFADKTSFWKLVQNVFNDGQINWGRIIVLFYAIGKLSAKMVLEGLPTVFSDILTLSLDYFRRTLLQWIRNMGGWISSISGLTRFSIEQFSSASSLFSFAPSPGLIMVFAAGALLGGLIVWRLK